MTVATGDTLATIAKNVYGDSALWYLIADANGLSGNSDLRVGQALSIPSRVGSGSNANTFTPYNSSKVIGDTSPNLPQPAPRAQGGGGGCGGLGSILIIVVIAVVTIYTAGAATAFLAPAGSAAAGAATTFGATMSLGASAMAGGAMVGTVSATALGATMGGMMAGAAIGAAVGSIAGQGVAMAAGMQKEFNWNQVGLSALSAGLTAGIGSYFGPTTNAWELAGRAALGTGLSQGIGDQLGMGVKFSWTNVALAAVSSGMNSAMKMYSPFKANDLFNNSMNGFASGMTMNALRGGKMTAAQVATDAFGNALGNSIAAQIGQGSQQALKAGTNQNPIVDPNTGEHIVMGAPVAMPTLPDNTPFTVASSAVLSDADADSILASLGLRTGSGNSLESNPNAVLYADASKYTGNNVVSDAGGGYGELNLGLSLEDKTGNGANVGGAGPNFADDVASRRAASDPLGIKAASVSARIDDLIAEAQVNKGLPFTGNLGDSEKAELYTRMYRSIASADAQAALDNGEKVIFGLRNETAWNANAGKGLFDDRVVVLQRGDDGKSILHYEGAYNTEPAGSYDQKSPNFGVARTSTGPGSDKDVNNDSFMDAGRLIGNKTYEYEWSKSASSYGPVIYGNNNVLRPVYSLNVERDVQHNGTYSYDAGSPADVAGKYDSGRTILFHRGYSGFTGSAGCQTFPVGEFANFAASIAPTPTQSRFFYTLKNM